MVEPLKFQSRIPELVGGGAAVLADAKSRLLTKRLSGEDAEDYVVNTILDVLKHRLRGPLTRLVEAKIDQVRAEHELVEGTHNFDDEDYEEWLCGFEDKMIQAFSGEVANVIGLGVLEQSVRDRDGAAEIVDTILELPIQDRTAALRHLGITDADVHKLMEEPTALITATPFMLKDLAGMIRARLAAEFDPDVLRDAVRTALETDDNAAFEAAVKILTDDPAEHTRLFDFTAGRPAAADDLEVEWVMTTASLPRLSHQKVEFTTRKEHDGLGRRALLALCEHSRITENALSAAIGVSRAQMNNYRHGRTPFEPDETQATVLRKLLAENVEALSDALVGLSA